MECLVYDRPMTTITVRQGSVTDADVDVLVNASNTLLKLGSGVSAAIRGACGAGYQDFLNGELARLSTGHGGLEPGAVVVTHAGTHPRARFVAHVAVMDYRDTILPRGPDEARIRLGSENLWQAIEALPLDDVAVGMVALGAGTGNLGVRLPTDIACETLQAHLARGPSKIRQVVFHGFSMLEYVNVLDAVSRHFTIDLTDVPAEVREHLGSLRSAT